MQSTSWQQFNLALCSLNLAEASTSVIERDVLAEIYASAAVTTLHTLTDHFNFIPVSVSVGVGVGLGLGVGVGVGVNVSVSVRDVSVWDMWYIAFFIA